MPALDVKIGDRPPSALEGRHRGKSKGPGWWGLPSQGPAGLLVLSSLYGSERHGSLFSREWRLSFALGGSLWLLRKVEGAWRPGPDGRLLNSPGGR